jgi:hypothetical protein
VTEQELQAIEDMIEEGAPLVIDLMLGEIAPALLAEVRRLQGLVKAAETGGPEGHDRCNTTGCPWCFEIGDHVTGPRHDPDCSAFSAPGVLR